MHPLRSTLMPRISLLLAFLLVSACAPGDGDAPGGDEPRAADEDVPDRDGASPMRLGPADGHDLPGIDLDRIQVGDRAPDFALESYDGDVVRLSDFRGEQNVVLVFYRGFW